MKKIFSLLAAVLFAGSMMAQVTILPTDFTATTEADYSVTKDGVTVAVVASTVTNDQMRIFKGKTITISAESNISSIVFTCTANGTAKYGPGCFNAQEGYTFEADGKTGTWTGSATSVTFTAESNQVRATQIVVTLAAGETPVEPGDEPSVLQAVSDSTTWDFSKITANTANALYGNEGIKLTDESTPSKNDEVIYADYSEDFMTFAEDFNKAAIAFKGEYPIRKNQYCQAGTLHFKADVAGTIVVKFSDTGSSASATAVKRYLVVNGEQTEYWTSRENNGETPYDAQLNVVSGKIEVPAGDVTITGSSAIVMYYVTFVPEEHTGTAINNTAAEIKTVKRIENGQLVIIKNGVRYNALGAKL